MKYALVGGQRQTAEPSLSGKCPVCESPAIARCGEIRVWHWAHKARRRCDPWWENETEWHRTWKDKFPSHWQEFVHHAQDGERHIADVRTDAGWILEFQHSRITPEERRVRETFYQKLIWVVDGTRLRRDEVRFWNAWHRGIPIGEKTSNVRGIFKQECRLLQEWSGSGAHVFLDFGQEQYLAWLLDEIPNGLMTIAQFPRAPFIEIHLEDDFDWLANARREWVAHCEAQRRARTAMPFSLQVRRPQ